jgi:hypothetical protein
MTEPEPLQQLDRTYVQFKNRKLIYFSGCDYFRLASHPRVLAAARNAINQYGLNVAASRMTTGNHVLYGELERRLSKFFGAADTLLVATGYITNLVVAQALTGNFSHVLIDERAHPSLHDAARFFDCPVLNFRHQEAEDVAGSVRRCGPGAGIILLTDGMSYSNGSTAPLGEYLAVLPKDAWMLVDDSHGAGVLGKTGKGTLEHAGVPRKCLRRRHSRESGSPRADTGAKPAVFGKHSPALAPCRRRLGLDSRTGNGLLPPRALAEKCPTLQILIARSGCAGRWTADTRPHCVLLTRLSETCRKPKARPVARRNISAPDPLSRRVGGEPFSVRHFQ